MGAHGEDRRVIILLPPPVQAALKVEFHGRDAAGQSLAAQPASRLHQLHRAAPAGPVFPGMYFVQGLPAPFRPALLAARPLR